MLMTMLMMRMTECCFPVPTGRVETSVSIHYRGGVEDLAKTLPFQLTIIACIFFCGVRPLQNATQAATSKPAVCLWDGTYLFCCARDA